MENRKLCIGILIGLMVLQVLLFRAYVAREVAPDLVLRGDPTWYTYFCYDAHDAMVLRDWDRLNHRAVTSPWGVLLFLQAGAIQMLLGAGRTSVLSLNMIYYLLAQLVLFVLLARLTRSPWAGLAAVGLFLAMASPFRGGPALNIRDFHFDLILFFLLIVSFYLLAVSDCLRRTKPSVILAVFCAAVVASRLISIVLFVAAFGAFLLVLLGAYLFGAKERRRAVGRRLGNFWLAVVIFVVLSALPIWIARKALYGHYLRYVFDEGFRKAREGLYVMGASSKAAEAWVVAKTIFAGDFGGYFLIGLILMFLWGLLGRVKRSSAGALKQTAEASNPQDRLWLHERADRRLFVGFLICFAVTSYGMHVAYTIKSDHMTRATAAPILLGLLLYLIPWLGRTFRTAGRQPVGLGVAAGLALGAGLVMQVVFYSGPGRGRADRDQMPAMAKLFDELAAIADDLKVKDLAISTDVVESFSLGSYLNYCNYEYERKGVLRGVIPRLGIPIEEPVDREKALALLKDSDVVILTREAPPPGWPLTESLRPMREEIRQFVAKRFAYRGTHTLYGLQRDVFCRPAWKVTASVSTEPRYGPERLLSEKEVQIWHAPWDGRTPQWVEFTASAPLRLQQISIIAQDGAPDRAPKTFLLQASPDGIGWTNLLEVKDAEFSLQQMRLDWAVRQETPCRKFRLWITRNGGAPTLLTIQGVRLVCSQTVPE